jgi:dipeptide/tripeptide permease
MAQAPSSRQSDPVRDESAREPARARAKILHILMLGGACATAYGVLPVAILSSAASDTSNVGPWFAFAYGVLNTLAVFPGGWLGDRYLGARRAAILGGLLAIAMLLLGTMKGQITTSLALAAAVASGGLMNANLPVALGRRYHSDDGRRLAGFVWFNGAVIVGYLSASGLRAVAIAPTSALLGTAFLVVIALGLFLGGSVDRSPGDDGPPIRSTVWKPAFAWVVSMAVVGGVVFYSSWFVPDSRLLAASVAIICAGIPAFFVSSLRSRHPAGAGQSSRAATELMVLLGAVGALFVLPSAAIGYGVDFGSEFGLPRLIQQAPYLLAFVVALIVARILRPLGSRSVAAARGALGVSFLLMGGIFLPGTIVTAVVGPPDAPQTLMNIFIVTWAVMDTLVSASGLHAVTACVPPGHEGRAVGAWRQAVSAGSRFGLLLAPRGADPDPAVVVSLAACCCFAGLALYPTRRFTDATIRIDTPSQGRIHRFMLRSAGLVAAASIVWVIIGRYGTAGAAATGATAPPPQFHGVARAYLPNDPTFGFVHVPGGQMTLVQPYVVMVGSYWIGKYEVTVAQYRQCVMEAGCDASDQRAILGPDTVPVRYVTWSEAIDYCKWLRRKLEQIAPQFLGGNDVALPSEPEWQRAAGDGTGPFPWNGPLTPLRANYAGSVLLTPVAVGEHASGASAYGVQDLSGNVAEWTRSEYRPYPYDPNDGRESVYAPAASKVIRGGSFYDSASLLRVDSRQAADPNRAYDFVGFRVVLVSTQQANPETRPPTAGPTGK